jgi:hypothetical protein
MGGNTMNPDHADHDTNDMPRAVEHALRKQLASMAEALTNANRSIERIATERDRMREAIDNGPCSCLWTREGKVCDESERPKTCWKRAALEGKP